MQTPKKVCILGAGTQGSISAAYWNRHSTAEIDWVFDSSIPAMSVGEGTTARIPQVLNELVGFNYSDLEKLRGTPKLGLDKKYWSNCEGFNEDFAAGSIGMHFTAVEFQKYMIDKMNVSRVKMHDRNVKTHDDIDADLIVDCRGAPQDLDDNYNTELTIPVNTASIVQCSWEAPKFLRTLTIAMPFGWIFGIPLQDRCSIGYVHNNNFCTPEQVQEGIDVILDTYGLTATSELRTISFNNYTRKTNFTERVYYNGNASFFLEPLEATSLTFGSYINEKALELYLDDVTLDGANTWYNSFASEIETVIMYNYFVGSMFDTDFWQYASSQGRTKLTDAFVNDPQFKMLMLEVIKRPEFPNLIPFEYPYEHPYGTWSSSIWKQNITHLGGITP